MKKTISIVLSLIFVLSLGIISFAAGEHYKIDTSKIGQAIEWSGIIDDENSDGLKQWTISFTISPGRSSLGNVAEIINQYCSEKKCIPVSVSTVAPDGYSVTVIAVVAKK